MICCELIRKGDDDADIDFLREDEEEEEEVMVENPSMLQIGSKIDITIELVNRMDVTEIIVRSSSSFFSSLLYCMNCSTVVLSQLVFRMFGFDCCECQMMSSTRLLYLCIIFEYFLSAFNAKIVYESIVVALPFVLWLCLFSIYFIIFF